MAKSKRPQLRRVKEVSRSSGLLSLNTIVFTLIGIGIAAFMIWHARSLDFIQDDAYISFRYVENALNGHGLVWNVGERVEGYTNFLWVMLLLLLGSFGLPLEGSAQFLGVFASVATIAVTMLIARHVASTAGERRDPIRSWAPAAIFAAAGSVAYWTISGLETPLFALLVTLSVWLFLRKSPYLGIALAAATLTRPEGGLVAAVLIGWELLFGRGWKRALSTAALAAAFLVPFAVFKWYYYGSLLPNSFYAKTGVGSEYLASGWGYFRSYLDFYGLWGVLLLPGLFALWKLNSRARVVIALWWIYVIYIIFIGGDVLYAFRFFVPLTPLFALGFIWGCEFLIYVVAPRAKPLVRTVILAVLACTAVFYTYYFPRDEIVGVRQRELGLTTKMTVVAMHLTAHDDRKFSIAASTIGKIGWELIDHPLYDMLGLTDSTVARHPEFLPGMKTSWKERKFNASYILDRETDYILFSTGVKPSAPAERALFLHSAFRTHYYSAMYPSILLNRNLAVWKRKPGPTPPDSVLTDLAVPDSINAMMNHRLDGDNVAALKAAKFIIDEGPGDFSYPYQNIANTAVAQRDYETAAAWADSAVAIDSFDVGAWVTRYWANVALRDTAEAYRSYAKVRQICPWIVIDSLGRTGTDPRFNLP